jgi:tetratricopeptide (TPR) repeat protein
LSAAFAACGRLEEALDVCREARALDPDNVAVVSGEAHAFERMGDFDRAYEAARPLIDSGLADTTLLLLFGKLAKKFGRSEEAIALLEERLADGITDISACMDVHGQLGRLYEAAGRYDEAFAHYRAANELFPKEFDPALCTKLTDDLISTFSADFLASAPRATLPSERLVFIVGMPRSGTSLVEQILASHPAVFGAGELKDLTKIAQSMPAAVNSKQPYPLCMDKLTEARANDLAARYYRTIDKLAPPDARRVTDKMPSNHLQVGLIAVLFPEARIIHCSRNPLDICLSCYQIRFTSVMPFTYDLSDLGYYYREYQRLMRHWHEALRDRILEVNYEKVVADQAAQTRAMLDFCGLDWDERCLRFYEIDRFVATASYDQVRKPLYSSSIGRWRRYEAHLEPLRKALGDAL